MKKGVKLLGSTQISFFNDINRKALCVKGKCRRLYNYSNKTNDAIIKTKLTTWTRWG